eukprot:1147974-Pelagomonas_calceolata.AAC.1
MLITCLLLSARKHAQGAAAEGGAGRGEQDQAAALRGLEATGPERSPQRAEVAACAAVDHHVCAAS